MSDGNGVTNPHAEDSFAESKGKGKAAREDVPHDTAMDEDENDDEDDDDEDDEEEEEEEEAAEPADEDGLEEIDLNNIVEGGRRTRGAKIDYARAAEQTPADDDEDEDDDEDFHPPNEDTEMEG
ncbi:hypothetical protein Trco_004412 [Trichoderma cornu-damae]|uniref:Histone chaperone domain-containing protein n=1 Tax=Trichoderma cornu-damae TaxID=654480 RepID=A0A9P8QMZ2_9HYPO|nr:hypothetical protein Trco_004412 [Trichoderma cornu-damae]